MSDYVHVKLARVQFELATARVEKGSKVLERVKPRGSEAAHERCLIWG